jgi:hypothetical protein
MHWNKTNSFVSKETEHLNGRSEASLDRLLSRSWQVKGLAAVHGTLEPGVGRWGS